MQVIETKKKAWVPSWVVSKGFFEASEAHKEVVKTGDLIEYLKGPIDGWVIIRNVGCGSHAPEWVPQECLPEK